MSRTIDASNVRAGSTWLRSRVPIRNRGTGRCARSMASRRVRCSSMMPRRRPSGSSTARYPAPVSITHLPEVSIPVAFDARALTSTMPSRFSNESVSVPSGNGIARASGRHARASTGAGLVAARSWREKIRAMKAQASAGTLRRTCLLTAAADREPGRKQADRRDRNRGGTVMTNSAVSRARIPERARARC